MTEPERDPGFFLGTPGKAREQQPMIMITEGRYRQLLHAESLFLKLQVDLAAAQSAVTLREKQMCEISDSALETIGSLLDATNSRTPEWDANIAGIRETIKSILE